MKATTRLWRYVMTLLALAAMSGFGAAAELNPAAVIYKLPERFPGARSTRPAHKAPSLLAI